MNKMKLLILGGLTTAMVLPGVTIAGLGQELTRFGAERAANAEGTIPEYAGGLPTAPAGVSVRNDGGLPNPFADEGALFRITAENMSDYEEYLTEAQMHLLKTQSSYYMDIYPSHRTASYP